MERSNTSADVQSLGRVIHGHDEHGKPITLLFASSANYSVCGAVVKRTIHAGYALLGIALSDAGSFLAHSLRFQTQHLYGWLGKSGFDRKERLTLDAYSVQYAHPPDEWFTITPDLELGIHGTYETGGDWQERRIREDAALTFRSKAGMSLARCNEMIHAVRLLLHLASLKKVFPVWITAYQNGHGYRQGEQWVEQDIEIDNSSLQEPKSESPIAHHWIFRFEDVCANFAGFMGKWIEYQEKYAEPLGCYSSTIYNCLTSELKHLSLTQALEAYHGARFQSHAERGLEAKLKKLATPYGPSLAGLVDNVEEFAKAAATTRHYYAHHNPNDLATGLVAKGANLIRLNEKLQLLFQMCVLSDLGIPEERFKRLHRQLATEIIEYA